MIEYSFLGRTAASTRLNTTFRGLAPSPTSGKTDLTYCSSVHVFLPSAAGRISAQTVKSVGGLLTVVLSRLAARSLSDVLFK
jgi:hypothetical protein